MVDIGRPKLNICIVNYRTPRLVIDCLASLLPELPKRAKVIIADSFSEDDSAKVIGNWLKANDPARNCAFIELGKNGGFSAGYNAAMKACPAENYLLLNSDTLVLPGAVMRLLEAAERDPKTGVFGPRLEWPDGIPQDSCFRDHSPFSEIILAARTRHVTALLKNYMVPMPVTNAEMHPNWISFAAVLIRHEVVETAGWLDDNFFLYFEDCEYCYRARRRGWSITYVPTARIVHLHGQSSQVESMITKAKRLPTYYYVSRARYFRLRYGAAGPTLANIGWCLGRLVSKTRETFGTKKMHLPEMAWKDIWVDWEKPNLNRREN
jgi:N-acetylglucosaminyl-diphospho-decaprenol L-rhamnosyltransferase